MNQLKRLLFVTHNFPPMLGGIAVFSWEICRGLAKLGVEVQCLTPTTPPAARAAEFRMIHFRERESWGKARRLAICHPLRHSIRHFVPQAIFLASLHPYGLFVRNFARFYKTPYAIGTHGSDIYRLATGDGIGRLEQWMGAKALQGAAQVFSVSRYLAGVAQDAAAGISAPIVIHNGVDIELFSPGSGDREAWSQKSGIDLEGRFVLTSVSSLNEHKGHRRVIEAIRTLADQHPDIVYLIAGDGPQKFALREQIQSLGLDGRVRLLGGVPRQDVASLLRSSDAFILNCQPEPGEGFGIVFLEAGACGLPVIAGNVGGVPEAVKNGETGILVDPQNVEHLTQAIMTLKRDPASGRQMGLSGRAWAEEHSWVKVVSQYYDALCEIVR